MALNIRSGTASGLSGYQMNKAQSQLADSVKRISSSKKINQAADDASSMVIANRLGSRALALGQSVKNANDAVSIIKIADGALGQAKEIVQNIRTKALQAANGSQSAENRAAIQAEISSSLSVLEDIAQNTSFNGQKLLSGSFVDKTFQLGESPEEAVSLSIGSVSPEKMVDFEKGSLAGIDVTTQQGAVDAIDIADESLSYISEQEASLGSSQNRLETQISSLSSARINLLSAQSGIEDVDLAEESANLNRSKLLLKAGVFARAQANANAQRLVNLIG